MSLTFVRRSVSSAVPVAAALLLFAAASAHADVKIVSQTSSTGGMSEQTGVSGPHTMTTYYKGDNMRMEAGKTVTIYNSASDTLYTLNTAQKTYTVTHLKSTVNTAMAMMDFKTVASMKPGGKTKMILGKPAHNYLWRATVAMTFKGGARPGGATVAPTPQQMPKLPTLVMEGEQWTTDAIKLPNRSNSGSFAPMANNMAGRISGMKPLFDKLEQMKGVPLASTSKQWFAGALPGVSGAQTPMVTTSETLSLSEAPLADALFAIPAGYKKTTGAPPAGGMRPRPGAKMPQMMKPGV